MGISELLTRIGDDNIMFQNLDNDIVRLKTRADGQSEITFGSQAQTTINGTERLGLVLWLNRDDVELAKKEQS